MGVHGLWKILEPAAQKASFRSLAACQGFERKYRDFPMLRIGVDASLLTSAAIAATRAGTIHSQAHNTALKNFFYRLCRLLDVPATFIFVFDGASRPAVKRGRNVVSDAPWVEAYARSMIEDFGFYSHHAPGEAEAELAELNQRGYIDAIISNDGDTLVFGGLNVIRVNMTSSSDPDNITVYHSDILEHADEVKLTRSGMVFFALCSGGDYSSGIQGCGPLLAYALAKDGFGDRLISALSLERQDFYRFMSTWRASLRHELRTNANNLFSSQHPSVADSITDYFPNLAILNLYLHPTTSFTLSAPPPSHQWRWIPRLPSLLPLSEFCLNHFAWDNETTLKRFREKVWRGAALRLYSFPLTLYSPGSGRLMAPDLSVSIIKTIGSIPGHGDVVKAVKVRLSTTSFVQAMGPRFDAYTLNTTPINVEVPHPISARFNMQRSCRLTTSSLDVIELTDSEMEESEVISAMEVQDIIELD